MCRYGRTGKIWEGNGFLEGSEIKDPDQSQGLVFPFRLALGWRLINIVSFFDFLSESNETCKCICEF